MKVALFVPCHIDGFFPAPGIGARERFESRDSEFADPADRPPAGRLTASGGSRCNAVAAGAPLTPTFHARHHTPPATFTGLDPSSTAQGHEAIDDPHGKRAPIRVAHGIRDFDAMAVAPPTAALLS